MEAHGNIEAAAATEHGSELQLIELLSEDAGQTGEYELPLESDAVEPPSKKVKLTLTTSAAAEHASPDRTATEHASPDGTATEHASTSASTHNTPLAAGSYTEEAADGCHMEIICVSDQETLCRPCVDCGQKTGRFCDYCYAADRKPDERWAPNQMTPLCSRCDNTHDKCHFCRGLAWCVPPAWRPSR